LRDPQNPCRRAGVAGRDVRIVRSDALARVLPLEVDRAAWVGQGNCSVLRDRGRAVETSHVVGDARLVCGNIRAWCRGTPSNRLVGAGLACIATSTVRLVQDVKGREVLPRKTLRVRWAGRDVRCEQSPGPRLWNSSLEPYRHGEETPELTEDHLLTSFGCDGLREELSNLAGVQVRLEAPHSRLTEARHLLGEVESLGHSREGVVVCALRCCATRPAEQVGEESGVASLLIGHELDKVSVRGGQPGSGKVGLGEGSEDVVEEIELDPLLVQAEKDGLIVKVGLDTVDRLGAACTKTSSWLIRNRLRVVQRAVGAVGELGRVGWQDRDSRCKRRVADSPRCGWCATVRAVACRPSDLAAHEWHNAIGGTWEFGDWNASVRGGRRDGGAIDRGRLRVGVGRSSSTGR